MTQLLERTLDEHRARRRRNLKRLLNARSIAFIGGASAAGGIQYCRALGFQGNVWAVNPTRSELGGVACVPRVSDLPGVPDAAWIAVTAERAIQTVRELNAIEAPSAVCYAAGFSESGDRELERQLVEAAGDVAICRTELHWGGELSRRDPGGAHVCLGYRQTRSWCCVGCAKRNHHRQHDLESALAASKSPA